MNPYRKIIALVCVYLVLFTSISAYSGVLLHERSGIPVDTQQLLVFTQGLPRNFIFEGKSSSSGFHGCPVEVTIYGFILQGFQQTEQPHFKNIRKVFIVNPDTFKASKSLILYPYHEFS